MFLTEDSNGQMVLDFERYDEIGLFLDKDGYIQALNVNLFARHLCQEFDIAIRYDTQFYQYKDNYWQRITELELKRILYEYFNSLLEDSWTASLEHAYLTAYMRVMPRCEELTPGNDYINVLNGLVYLGDKWRTLSHDKEVFTTTQIPVTFEKDKNKKCSVFMAFLKDIFNNDESMIDLVQEIMGYCLSNSTQAHKFFIFYGKGRNGKSTLLNIMTALVGKDNTSNISLKGFNTPFELANIVEKRVNISTENTIIGSNMQTDKLKMISAGDSIQINPKNEKPFSYTAFAKLIFAVNTLPSTADSSEGFMDRLVIVPFNRKYVDNPQNDSQGKRDPELTNKMLMELDGIFNFALKGLKRLIRNGYTFTESTQSTMILNQYKATINPYIDFIDNQIYIDENAKVARTLVYDTFKQWVKLQGFKAFENVSARVFYEELAAELRSLNASFSTVKIKGKYHFKGIRLNSNEIDAPLTNRTALVRRL